ncbi:hypothetical protein GC177_02380 [bacterium]|nr:hypothetical protein [bacterium]
MASAKKKPASTQKKRTGTQARSKSRQQQAQTKPDPRSNDKRQDVPVSDFIPYACHFNPHTLLTKNGELLQIIKIVGFTTETVGKKKIKLRDAVREAVFDSIPDDSYALWFHTIRRRKSLDPGGNFPAGLPSYVNRRWCEQHDWENKFINELYITIVREGQEVGISHPLKFARALWPSNHRRYREDFLFEAYAELEQTVQGMLYTLEQFGARRLSLEERDDAYCSEPMEFFSKIIHLENNDLAVPEQDISSCLGDSVVGFGYNLFEVRSQQGRHFGAMLTIKEYRELNTNVLDEFLQLPQEMVITQCVDFVNPDAVKRIYDYQQSINKISGDDEFAEISGLKDVIESDRGRIIDYGEQQLCIMLSGESIGEVEQSVARTVNGLHRLGIVVMREDVRLEETYWSQLPGNFEFITRLRPINIARIGGFASLHNFPAGQAVRNHWGAAVSVFYTAFGTPYFFNFHTGDNGHTLIIGPYGAGKTVLLNFLCCEAQKFSPRMLIFDHSRASEIFIHALGGHYFHPIQDTKSGRLKLNPLLLNDTPETRNFWAEWLWSLMTYRNDELNEAEVAALMDVAGRIGGMPKPQRRLYNIALALHETGHTRLGQLLMPWCQNGPLAHVFDHETDNLPMDERTLGFDMAEVLKESEAAKPMLLYMLFRLHISLTGKPTIVVFDEAWQLLDNNIFTSKIGPWLEKFRARNTMVIFATEMPEVAGASRISPDIMRHIATEIYLPNSDPGASYTQVFGLNDREIALLKKMKREFRHFLLRHNGEAVVGELNLTDMEDVLCVLSGTPDNLALYHRAVAEAGDNPAEWLPVLQHYAMERADSGAKEAA